MNLLSLSDWIAAGQALLDSFARVESATQWLLLVLAALAAWMLSRRLEPAAAASPADPMISGNWRHDLQQRLRLPLCLLGFTLLAQGALWLLGWSYTVLWLASQLAAAMALIRILAYLLRRTMRPGPMLAWLERSTAIVLWTVFALHLVNGLAPVMSLLDAMALPLGERRISMLNVLTVIVVVAVALLCAGLLASSLERRLMAQQEISIGVRVGMAKVLRFGLILLALIVGLNVAGITLTSLTVFSGALGVGIGFGLQRIASNFISGFLLILDRSIRPGDVITVGESFGWVKELRARYVVVRNRDGVETLIPNETLITSEVINWSYSDKTVRLKAPVQISYDDDPEQAMALLVEVANSKPRVLKDPKPVARLMSFGDNGIDLELRVWIEDPEDGVNNIRSDLNVGIWRAFKAAGITIPYPQRDLYIKSAPASLMNGSERKTRPSADPAAEE